MPLTKITSIIFIPVLLCLLISSCNNQDEQAALQDPADPITFADTLVNGVNLRIMYQHGFAVSILRANGDTLLPYNDANYNFEVVDLDRDGYPDIKANHIMDMLVAGIFLYDPQTKDFRLLRNWSLDFEPIPGTDLFYSYQGGGCANADWESTAFSIKADSVNILGRMSYNGCLPDATGLEFYKERSGVSQLIRKGERIDKYDSTTNRIEEYWVNHYKEITD